MDCITSLRRRRRRRRMYEFEDIKTKRRTISGSKDSILSPRWPYKIIAAIYRGVYLYGGKRPTRRGERITRCLGTALSSHREALRRRECIGPEVCEDYPGIAVRSRLAFEAFRWR